MPRARFGEGMASGRLIDLALERDIGLATATGDIDLTTDVGRMVARILAAVASAETERNAERQILANDLRVAAGKPQWIRRPFGYEMEGTLREAEAAAVLKAYHDVLAGKALTTVAREWNEAGFRTSAPDAATARPRAPRKNDYDPSGLWNNVAVRFVLRAPRNRRSRRCTGKSWARGTGRQSWTSRLGVQWTASWLTVSGQTAQSASWPTCCPGSQPARCVAGRSGRASGATRRSTCARGQRTRPPGHCNAPRRAGRDQEVPCRGRRVCARQDDRR